MPIVIEDRATVEQIEKLAAQLHVTPVEAVERAVRETAAREAAPGSPKPSREEVFAAVRRAQEAFRMHGSKDKRPHEEIIGYNEHGHFD